MKKYFFLITLLLLSAYASFQYKQNGFTSLQNLLLNLNMGIALKCTTASGKTLYGRIPASVRCSKLTIIKDKVSVLKSETNLYQLTKESLNPYFQCDGRQRCNQMNSRAEAEYYLVHCPNTKMDSDGDGVPCENDSRW